MNQKGLAQILLLGFITAVLIAGISFGYVKYFKNENTNTIISNFKKCVAAGYPVMESYPRQCAAGGQTFTEVINDNADQVMMNSNINTRIGNRECVAASGYCCNWDCFEKIVNGPVLYDPEHYWCDVVCEPGMLKEENKPKCGYVDGQCVKLEI